ncbi:hypothetical protein [Bradyrhizobium viridifuturi]|uniref:hypothetical protein n=1 Tax=Bradyrhizobium viridifuturi TaxID=1654716 RepID=UPI000AF8A90E|nr:hypothetical protein [Bradyrhizobium viridifuturi]
MAGYALAAYVGRPALIELPPDNWKYSAFRFRECESGTISKTDCAAPWIYFELRRSQLSRTDHTMTAAFAERNSPSSERSWNLKAELSFIRLNASGAETVLGPIKFKRDE